MGKKGNYDCSNKNLTKLTRSHLAGLLVGKERNNHLISITFTVLLIWPTPSPSWGNKITHPSPQGPPSEPKKCDWVNQILLRSLYTQNKSLAGLSLPAKQKRYRPTKGSTNRWTKGSTNGWINGRTQPFIESLLSHLLRHSDSSYPVPLMEWWINHP